MAVIRTEHRSDELDRASIVYFLIVKLIYTEHLFVSALILSWFFRTPATQKRRAKFLITPPPDYYNFLSSFFPSSFFPNGCVWVSSLLVIETSCENTNGIRTNDALLFYFSWLLCLLPCFSIIRNRHYYKLPLL